MSIRGSMAGALCLLGLAGCAHASSPAALPARDAPAAAVLDAYLHALVAADCGTTHALAGPAFQHGNGELCGTVAVQAFAVNPAPATIGPDEVEFAAVLTTTSGSADGTVPAGKVTWFYDLQRLDGQWRLAGGGSGP